MTATAAGDVNVTNKVCYPLETEHSDIAMLWNMIPLHTDDLKVVIFHSSVALPQGIYHPTQLGISAADRTQERIARIVARRKRGVYMLVVEVYTIC